MLHRRRIVLSYPLEGIGVSVIGMRCTSSSTGLNNQSIVPWAGEYSASTAMGSKVVVAVREVADLKRV